MAVNGPKNAVHCADLAIAPPSVFEGGAAVAYWWLGHQRQLVG